MRRQRDQWRACRCRSGGSAPICSKRRVSGAVRGISAQLPPFPPRRLCAGDDERGVCELGEGAMPVPCLPLAHLILVQSHQSFRVLERRLDTPAPPRHLHPCLYRRRSVGPIVGALRRVAHAAAREQPAVGRPAALRATGRGRRRARHASGGGAAGAVVPANERAGGDDRRCMTGRAARCPPLASGDDMALRQERVGDGRGSDARSRCRGRRWRTPPCRRRSIRCGRRRAVGYCTIGTAGQGSGIGRPRPRSTACAPRSVACGKHTMNRSLREFGMTHVSCRNVTSGGNSSRQGDVRGRGVPAGWSP
jgi:hypothetical protein